MSSPDDLTACLAALRQLLPAGSTLQITITSAQLVSEAASGALPPPELATAASSEPTRPRSTSAVRMARKRARDALKRHQTSPSDGIGDASDAGGLSGGSVSEEAEKPGKESEKPEQTGTDLLGSNRAARDESDASPPSPSLDDDAKEVFDFWRAETGKQRALYDRKRENRIKARLREGRTKAELKQAIANRKNSLFLMGSNDHGTVYDGIETLLRDAAQVEKLLALAEPQVVRGPAPGLLEHAQRIQLQKLEKPGAERSVRSAKRSAPALISLEEFTREQRTANGGAGS